MNLLDNGLVALLSQGDQDLVQRRCQPVHLKAGDVLCSPANPNQDVHFLTGACVAMFVRDGADGGLALGLAGYEGAVGLQCALGLGVGNFTLLVQTSGAAWRADGTSLQTLVARRPAVLMAFARHIWTVAQEVALHATCSQAQDIKGRLARWICMSGRRSRQAELNLTHEHLARMLGVRRTSVTLAAVELKEEGLLDYQRGRIQIRDWQGLEAVAFPPVAAQAPPAGATV